MLPSPEPSLRQAARPNSLRHKILLVLTYLISAACLVWVLRDADLEDLGGEIARMKWAWVAVAIAADILVYVIQGWRWSILLEPIARIPGWRCVRAIYVGLFANEVLPFRSGEIIRCFLLARWSKIPFPVILSSGIVERVFDGFLLVATLFLTLQFVELPRFIAEGGRVLAIGVAVLAAILGYLMFLKQHAKTALENNPSKWARQVHVLLDDLHLMGHSPSLWKAGLASIPSQIMQLLPIYALFRAYGFAQLTLGDAIVTMVILRMGTVIPGAPGNLGTFQFLAAVALTMLGVEESLAKRFSLILWGVITLPLLLAGFVAVAVSGLKIRKVRQEAENTAEASAIESRHVPLDTP